MYLSETESLFCLTGSELGKAGSIPRDRCLTSAEDNKINKITGNLLFSCLYVTSTVHDWLSNLDVLEQV